VYSTDEEILSNQPDKMTIVAANNYNISKVDTLNNKQSTAGFFSIAERNNGTSYSKNYFEEIYNSTPEAILILDENNIVIDANRGFERMFLFSHDEIIGKHMEELITPASFSNESIELFAKLRSDEKIHKESIRTKGDGSHISVLITGCKIKLSEKKYGSFVAYTDISKHEPPEELMRTSLVEKEVLIREIHHRVKNNLQIISSLLDLQSKKIEDKEFAAMFTNCQSRVKSIALIHEKLYQTNSFTRVDFGGYTKNLVHYLFRMFDVKSDRISLKLNTENVYLPMNIAIPCGLIINELVTNSLKHAFEETGNGKLTIEVKYISGNRFTLIVKDNGKGLPAHINFRKTDTLGFSLINNLTQQLGGNLEIKQNNGTEFKITFSILNQ
jgi:PAS domain S-box-containing protein